MTQEDGKSRLLDDIMSRREDERSYHNHKETVIYLAMGAVFASIPVFYGESFIEGVEAQTGRWIAFMLYVLAHLFVRWQQRQRERSAVLIDLYNKASALLLSGVGLKTCSPLAPLSFKLSLFDAVSQAILPSRQVCEADFRGPNMPGFMDKIITDHFSSQKANTLGRFIRDAGGQVPSILTLSAVIFSFSMAITP